MKSAEKILRNAGTPTTIPTNRDLTLSLIGSIIRFAIDAPQVLARREEITPDKLLFLLLPIVRNLGKLIDRIRCSAYAATGVAPNVSGHFPSSNSAVHYRPRKISSNARNTIPADDGTGNERAQPPLATESQRMWPDVKKTFSQHQQTGRHHDDEQSSVGFKVYTPKLGNTSAVPFRQQFRQKNGNYAIREITDKWNLDGSVQRSTRTISGPDITILTNITRQLSDVLPLSAELSK